MESQGAGLAFPGSVQGTEGGAQMEARAQACHISASLVVFGEIFLAVAHVGLDCVTAWLPASRTDLKAWISYRASELHPRSVPQANH